MSMGLSGALSWIWPEKARGYPGRVLLDKPELIEHSSICHIQVYPNKVFLLTVSGIALTKPYTRFFHFL